MMGRFRGGSALFRKREGLGSRPKIHRAMVKERGSGSENRLNRRQPPFIPPGLTEAPPGGKGKFFTEPPPFLRTPPFLTTPTTSTGVISSSAPVETFSSSTSATLTASSATAETFSSSTSTTSSTSSEIGSSTTLASNTSRAESAAASILIPTTRSVVADVQSTITSFTTETAASRAASVLNSEANAPQGGLSSNQTAGIAVSSILSFILIVALIFFFWRRRFVDSARRRQLGRRYDLGKRLSSSLDGLVEDPPFIGSQAGLIPVFNNNASTHSASQTVQVEKPKPTLSRWVTQLKRIAPQSLSTMLEEEEKVSRRDRIRTMKPSGWPLRSIFSASGLGSSPTPASSSHSKDFPSAAIWGAPESVVSDISSVWTTPASPATHDSDDGFFPTTALRHPKPPAIKPVPTEMVEETTTPKFLAFDPFVDRLAPSSPAAQSTISERSSFDVRPAKASSRS
ncbi:hypothetical protein B0H63DRAFT_464414 [Podospora didyma]|uniref:Uncharacterized protein n=1 Tax=Podospora didyma TaxID=330526 RepID=A0AAE0U3T4_9PEZI|nr:hypothetical protein B0H63DRAFT_464414 [Podospora didyma]